MTLSGPAEGSNSIHFACLIGSPETPNYSGSDLMLPAGSPFLQTPLGNEVRRLAARRHRIDLDTSVSIQLVSAALRPDLTVPITFTTRARRKMGRTCKRRLRQWDCWVFESELGAFSPSSRADYSGITVASRRTCDSPRVVNDRDTSTNRASDKV